MKLIVNAVYFLSLYILAAFFTVTYAQGIKVISYDNHSITVEYSPIIKSIEEADADGVPVLIPLIDNTFYAAGISGAPANLATGDIIAVPGKTKFTISSISVGNVKRIAGIISPVPTIVNDNEIAREKMVIDKNAYQNQMPQQWATVEYKGLSRDVHLSAIRFLAARYNPEIKAIEIPEKITITINFDLDDFSNPVDKTFAPVLNVKQFETWNSINKNNISLQKKSEPINIQSLSDGQWYKVKVNEEGIFKITSSMLTDMGINIPNEKIETIKIFGNGGDELSYNVTDALNNKFNEQKILVNKNPNGSLESIVFYGAPANGFKYDKERYFHFLNHYSKSNYYMLTWGGDPGKRASALTTPDAAPDIKPVTYTHMFFHEEELVNPYDYGAGRTWFGETYLPSPLRFDLHNLDKNGEIGYIAYLAHRAKTPGTFSVKESNQLLGSTRLYSTGGYTYAYRGDVEATMPANVIGSDNKTNLKFEYTNDAGPSGTSYFLDFVEIFYPRPFLPINNEIGFFTDTTWSGVAEFIINSFQGNNILGFDVTDRTNPEMIKNISSTGGMFKFKHNLEGDPRRFFVSANYKTPVIEQAEIVNLRSEFANTEVIVVTHKNLLNSANAFKEYRESNSELNISVVTTEHIYNEFGSGVPDITAIRDFIAHAYHNWTVKPQYLVFWGDGHYDYKNISTQTINFIPPFQSADDNYRFDETSTMTTEDYFMRVSGDDSVPDLTQGRLTISSDEQGFEILEKIKHYENNSSHDSWRTAITLVGDDGINSNEATEKELFHTAQSEDIGSTVPEQFQLNKIYLGMYPSEYPSEGRRKPKVTEEMLNTINNKGNLILSWIGHGNPRVWAFENILDRDKTIPLMTNKDKLFFLTAATCDFARFDKVDGPSGAEVMFLSDKGGAIGSFAASRIVLAFSNHDINKKFYGNLFTREDNGLYPRLGDALFKTKIVNNDNNDQKFFLLGDPTMRLLAPQYKVKIETINGIDIDELQDEPVKLKALEEVEFTGTIREGVGSFVPDFNGIAMVTMYDGDIESIYTDDQDHSFPVKEYGGALNKSNYKVENGRFTAKIIIPKDISFSEKNGRFFVYAYSDDDRYALGATTEFIIDDITTGVPPDNNGPEINIYLEDIDNFYPGATVRKDPLLIVRLEDDTGINSTGLGIGHKIEAWIDDDHKSVDLTPEFQTSLENNRAGFASKRLNELKPGMHTVKVRAWDIYNNFSIGETYFNVARDNIIILEELMSYPNPFNSEMTTTIRFKHNLSPPFDLTVSIINSQGKLVRELKKFETTSYFSEVEWDGKDMNNNSVATGAYYYQVHVNSEDSGSATLGGAGSIKID